MLDESVFSSASDVNSMVTSMAIVDWASRNIARVLGKSRIERNVMARL